MATYFSQLESCLDTPRLGVQTLVRAYTRVNQWVQQQSMFPSFSLSPTYSLPLFLSLKSVSKNCKKEKKTSLGIIRIYIKSTKTNLKLITHLNVRANTIKIPGEIVELSLCDLELGIFFSYDRQQQVDKLEIKI